MSDTNSTRLFGQGRTRVGYEDDEWSVWILGMDDIHPKSTLAEALEFAAEHNAVFAELRLKSTSEFDPICYAVVLHYGYAWNQAAEHAHGVNCGIDGCATCSSSEVAA